MEEPEIRKDAQHFNEDFKKELAKKGKSEKEISEFRAIDFKVHFTVKVELSFVTIYILKYVPEHLFLRRWLSGFEKLEKINHKIGCSHFMLTLNKSQLQIEENGKLMKFSMKKVKGYNIKLVDKTLEQD